MMAVLSQEVEVLGVTTTCGNMPLDKAEVITKIDGKLYKSRLEALLGGS